MVSVICNEKEAGGSADLENLPDDLKEIVTCDNKAFAEEIAKWDRDMARKATGGGDADVSIVVEQKAGTVYSHDDESTLILEHQELFFIFHEIPVYKQNSSR